MKITFEPENDDEIFLADQLTASIREGKLEGVQLNGYQQDEETLWLFSVTHSLDPTPTVERAIHCLADSRKLKDQSHE